MDPAKLQEYIERECHVDSQTGKLVHAKSKKPVTAIVPVHIYGRTADMDPILELARRYNLIVIEDACQAHGAEYFSKKENCWRKAGSMGHAAAFSFYPGKNLGACGEAGAITTNDAEMARQMRMMRDHGQAKKYFHSMEGYNGRLDSLQAGILSVKLHHLQNWNAKRNEAAKRYDEQLSAIVAVKPPRNSEDSRPVYHLYVIRTANRKALQQHLTDSNIHTGIHYPIPLHLQDAYKHLGYAEGSFPITEKVASEILSLPMYPQLGEEQTRRVVDEIARHFSSQIHMTQPVAAVPAAISASAS